MPLKIVPPRAPTPTEEVTLRVKKMPKPASMLQCNRCGSRELVPVVAGALFKNGKVSGGTKIYYCFSCMLKGERTEVM